MYKTQIQSKINEMKKISEDVFEYVVVKRNISRMPYTVYVLVSNAQTLIINAQKMLQDLILDNNTTKLISDLISKQVGVAIQFIDMAIEHVKNDNELLQKLNEWKNRLMLILQ